MSKKCFVLISFVLLLGLVSNASADLVGQWKLDDGAGTTAMDATGNGHDGELIGNPQWVVGYFGGGLQFSGSTDKVDIPHSADLNPENEFTVSVWANVDPAGSGHRSPVTSRDDYPQRGYIIYCEPGNTWQFWTGSAGGGWNSVQGPAVNLGEWTHLAATYASGEKKFYVNGELSGEGTDVMALNTAQVLRIGAGATEGAGNYFFQGIIDDVRVYNHVLSEADVKVSMENQGGAIVKAYGADPKNGAMLEATWVTLGWRAGDFAVSHDVYMGDNFDDVNNGTADTFQGNLADTMLIVGFVGFPFPDGLVPGTTYYWRIDEVNPDEPNSPWKGDVWSFWIPPKVAWQPAPGDGVNYVATDIELSWTPGFGAQLHTVYFGESLDEVTNATGGAAQSTTTYTPGPLAKDTVYYWRVDEFEAPVTHKGDVWSFRTLPDIPVTDPSLLAWWKLDEAGGTNVLDWSGHGHHGTLGEDASWVDGYDLTGVQFDGRGDYVGFGTPADLYLPDTYTYTAWFKPGEDIYGDSGPQYLLCIGSRSDLVFGVEDGVGVNGDLMLHYYDTQPSFNAVGVGQTSWNANEWHMVVGTKDATGHKIYLDGELKNFDANINQDNFGGATSRMISLGARAWTGHQYFNGSIDDVRIYNKALTDEEIQQVMLGNTKLAGSPVPDRNALVDIRDISSLSWSKGDTAVSHDVYFGQDRDAVAGADNSSSEFQGNQAGTSLSLAGLVEFGGGDYYWRIDEVESDGTVIAGTIWKFTVPDYLIVEDFESYNDIEEGQEGSNRIYNTWIDGYGTTDNGSQAGNLDVPFMSQGHSGAQAMPLLYDNAGKTSEATRTLTSKKDWTEQGVTKLVIWFSGDSGNAADRMFVALGNAIVYHPDDAATQEGGWNEWAIDLQEFANQGTDLTNVGSITLGFGTRGAPVATGGTGTVHFDDISLYR
jgi:hypothetical protein